MWSPPPGANAGHSAPATSKSSGVIYRPYARMSFYHYLVETLPICLDVASVHISGACPGGGPGWHDTLQPGEILLRQCNVDSLEVFLEMPAGLAAWNREDVVTLGQQPGQC